uniref:Uncharacterized protein n=1 Tax=Timema bartmani TaxID=61472 RepID=A0A7R9EV21_9NEOP|nr:unnamed protein product [Timema bartmani]
MYFLAYFMVFVRIWGASSAAPEQRLGELAAAWSALFETPTTDNPNKCQGCGERRVAVEDTMASSQLTAMRIEYIKQQILKKLRLKEPPTISRPLSSLPKPLANGTVLSKTRGVPTVNKDVDDFYGKTDQVIIFPKEGLNLAQGTQRNFREAEDLVYTLSGGSSWDFHMLIKTVAGNSESPKCFWFRKL